MGLINWLIETLGGKKPLVDGCACVNGKYYSAVKGEISKEEYKKWEEAMGVISKTMKFLRSKGTIKVLEGKRLDDFRIAKSIEAEHLVSKNRR